MTWPVDPRTPTTHPAALLREASRVEYIGPGTTPDTGTVVDIVPQVNADDLYVIAWDHHPGDFDLYHPSVLKAIAR